MLDLMGFKKEWVSLIMWCLDSISYLVILNGKVGEVFRPNRGLCQGDPLSPFLFLVCSERLTILMKLILSEGILKGAKVSRRSLQITHLLFTNDYVFIQRSKNQ